jgi:hypothetical protein
MKPVIALGAVVVGFALLAASSVWGKIFPPTQSWTLEKADRMSKVKASINDVGAALYKAKQRIHAGPDPGPLQAEYDALIKEFDQLKREFESAAERPQTASAFLKWTGISLAVLGLVGWYAVKDSS